MRLVLSIRLKLLLLVALACLPAMGLVLHSGLEAQRQALREAQAQAGRISRDLALREQHLTAGARQFLATLARLPDVRTLDAKACAPLFRELLTANPFYSDVVLTSLTGEVLASAQTVPAGLNLKESAFFPLVLKTGAFAVGGYRKSRTTGLHVLVCGHPVYSPKGELVGTVSTGLRLGIFDDIVRDIKLPAGSTIFMVDAQGLRVFNRHFPKSRPELYPPGAPVRPNIWRVLREQPKGVPFFDIGADDQRRMFVVQESTLAPQASPYLYVAVSLPEATVLQQARQSLYSGLTLLSLGTLLAGLGAWLMGKKVFVERIERLAQVAGSFAAGDLSARANLPGPGPLSGRPDELGRLGLAVDRIGEELSRREAEREATLERLARTQFAVDNAGDEIYWTDEAGRILYANESAARSLGYTRQELQGMHVFDIEAAHTPESWRNLLQRLASGHSLSLETQHKTRTGTLITKDLTLSLVRMGETPIIFGTGRDVRERKRHEATLRSLLDETAAVTGREFFQTLTARLVSVLEMPAAFAGEYLDDPAGTVRPLGLAHSDEKRSTEHALQSGAQHPTQDFPLALSPGRNIPRDGHLLIVEGVRERYPDNPYLAGLNIEGYLGVPMLNAAGEKIGHLSIMSRNAMQADPALLAILRLFAQRAAAELVRLRAEREILSSLREKEVLLKEIHHRVKNNMQIISSLLSLQARDLTDPAMLDLVDESRARILSMALVHEDLYQTGNLAQVDFRHYLQRLAERTRSGLAGAARVDFELELAELALPVDQAIPLGLLCNELFTNALKHAFPSGTAGVVRVRLERADGQVVVTVRDNGPGLPPGFEPGQGATLGLQLVWSLADQLHGRMEAVNDSGAVFTLRFPVG